MSVNNKNHNVIVRRAADDFRSSWPALATTYLACRIITIVILAPLAGLLFRGLLAVFGKTTLSDMDILFFCLGPGGCFCLILLGAIWLAILVFEQAALVAIVYARDRNQLLTPAAALRFAAAHAWPIFRVTIRIVTRILVCIAPLLAIAAAVYLTLLSEYDINYYLKEKPPIFMGALAVGVLLGMILILVLLYLISNWFFSLPLVLFEGTKPSEVLSLSNQRAQGQRYKILRWLVIWFFVTSLISTVVTILIGLLGRLVIPDSTAPLQLLAMTVGTVLLLWAAIGLIVNLFSTTTFAVLLFQLYRQLGCTDEGKLVAIPVASKVSPMGGIRLTRTRVFIGTLISIVIATWISISTLVGVQAEDHVTIMAHRGASKSAPENTLASIRQAIADGADWVEIDVQETADGEVVVFHDSDFMKLAGLNLKIWDARMEDLQKIDIGSWFDRKFVDERVPTLAAVLQECRGKIGVNIELKYYGHDQQLEQRVASIVAAHEMNSHVKAMSLKIDGVRKMKALRPDWEVGLLMSVSAGKVKNIEADFLAVNASFANRNLIQAAHDQGKEIYVWTVNDGPQMSEMISRGVDGILTDNPALARSVLKQRAEMSVPERLLLEIAGLIRGGVEIGEQ
ncbi:MAG: glycerophosphodiester phosphodiesterase [Planctomycetaceae bacterium]|nr:glycerophosphodiester phosphodiesterase [Planctomycetaceae bacterium]